MSDEQTEEQRKPGVPKYFYWAKSPPKPRKVQRGFVNVQQKKFYIVQLAFRLAQIGAIVAACVLIFSVI
ncbi:MAG TPA: hypothetical protein VLX56_03340 [Nitrososphaerales archaeon]|nr:hypothetical protein [Nitrososphaerales archaeon]